MCCKTGNTFGLLFAIDLKKYLLMTILLCSFYMRAICQSLIVGIPSADVAEKGHFELTHETQLNFWQSPLRWNSFNFFCYGINHTMEVTMVLNNLDNRGSENRAIGIGFKKFIPFSLFGAESRIYGGGNLMFNAINGKPGVWCYSAFAQRVPVINTRLTAGITYGQSQVFGFRNLIEQGKPVRVPNNQFCFMAAFEQPITKHFSLIADWYSGDHDLAMFIPAMQFDWKHHTFITGYKIPNRSDGFNAIILEYMITLK
jgi:hypothetical protein